MPKPCTKTAKPQSKSGTGLAVLPRAIEGYLAQGSYGPVLVVLAVLGRLRNLTGRNLLRAIAYEPYFI